MFVHNHIRVTTPISVVHASPNDKSLTAAVDKVVNAFKRTLGMIGSFKDLNILQINSEVLSPVFVQDLQTPNCYKVW